MWLEVGKYSSRNQKQGQASFSQLMELQLRKLAMSKATQLQREYSQSMRYVLLPLFMMFRLFRSLWHRRTKALSPGSSFSRRYNSFPSSRQESRWSTMGCYPSENCLVAMVALAWLIQSELRIQSAKRGMLLMASSSILWKVAILPITLLISFRSCRSLLLGCMAPLRSSSILNSLLAQQHLGPIPLLLPCMEILFSCSLAMIPSTLQYFLKIRDLSCPLVSVTLKVMFVSPDSLCSWILLLSRLFHSGREALRWAISLWYFCSVSTVDIFGNGVNNMEVAKYGDIKLNDTVTQTIVWEGNILVLKIRFQRERG